jgi:hypothetical protein
MTGPVPPTNPHNPDAHSEVLECGCALLFDTDPESGTLAWLTPCSQRHRLVAMLTRKPGSMLIVCQVPA